MLISKMISRLIDKLILIAAVVYVLLVDVPHRWREYVHYKKDE